MKHRITIISSITAALISLSCGLYYAGAVQAPAVTQVVASTPTKPVPVLQITAPSLLVETNEARAEDGLPALVKSPALEASANEKCQDMLSKQYWSHTGPDGTEPWQFIARHTTYARAGENLAYGFMTANAVVDGWMNSPGHKANILAPFGRVGFGICSGDYMDKGKQIIVVQHFTD